MVNRGRPSKDCLPCRKRKLRCDLVKGGCGQCRRAGIPCFGYRDSNELLFHDQTQSIQQKVSPHQVARLQNIRSDPGSVTSLQLSWDVRARHDFFARYVFGLSASYDMLATLYGRAKSGDQLAVSVDAVSLAFFAQSHSTARQLSGLAARLYVTALQRVSQALVSPDLATADSTLQSVLLLDLYEKMTHQSRLSPASSWMNHVDGALALVKRRGSRNIETYVGRRLASRLYITLLISCGAASVRIPDELEELRNSLHPFQDESDVKWLVTALNVQTINFNADLRLGKYTSASDIIAECIRLDGLYIDLESRMPLDWYSKRVGADVDASGLVFGDSYDVYTDHIVTQVRNVIRTLRIHLHIIIRNYFRNISSAEGRTSAEASRSFINKCAEDICATAPQFALPGARKGIRAAFTPLQVMQCYTLLAPLYLAGHASTNPKLRRWAVDVMTYMADVGGMEMAKKTAEILRMRPDMEYWDIYTMLGSYAFAA